MFCWIFEFFDSVTLESCCGISWLKRNVTVSGHLANLSAALERLSIRPDGIKSECRLTDVIELLDECETRRFLDVVPAD